MSTPLKAILELKEMFTQNLSQVSSAQDLDAVRVAFVGKKGHVTNLLKQLGSLSIEEKRELGPLIQKLKKEIEESVNAKRQENILRGNNNDSSFDVTAYHPGYIPGTLHPYTHFIREVEHIFSSMGFDLLDGPELETDENNFSKLNIPQDHPARDMYDTFWTTIPGMLLRTHTSSVQARTMKSHALPLAGISIGRVFRHEAVDASHDTTFMQCEGIYIDKNVTLKHLFGVIQECINALFNTKDLTIRTRPGFFPFVEPGVEIDMQCPFCTKGCSTCKKTRWIEVFPGGMIHPNVLKAAGIDHTKYSGFAFGFGLTRLAMLKYKIRDIRLFHSGKVAFLDQFS